MRVLITNNSLAERAGSELYVRDVAAALLLRGHRPVAFSTRLGAVAEDLRRATVPVVSDLSNLAEPPDIIHGQHHLETMMALLHFPAVPAVYFCHGWLPWEEAPPRFPRVFRYVAVDDTCRDRLVGEWGIPPDRVDVILNFVDLSRFRPREPLPTAPRRALVFGNTAAETTGLRVIREACRSLGIALDVMGEGFGRAMERPEEELPSYDLVFAKGRAALEAMAVGAAVVACDCVYGLAGLVTSENFEALRRMNFGLRCLHRRVEVEAIVSEIAGYDSGDAALVSERVRAHAGREQALDRIVQVYEQVLSAAPPLGSVWPAEGDLRAAALYLRWLGPEVKTSHLWRERDYFAARVRELEADLKTTNDSCARYAAEHDRLASELAASATERKTLGESCAALRGEVERLSGEHARLVAAEAELLTRGERQREELKRQATELGDLRAVLSAREETLTWRLRERLFASRLLRQLYRGLRRLPPEDTLRPPSPPPAEAIPAVGAPTDHHARRNETPPEDPATSGPEPRALQARFEQIGRTQFLGVPVEGFAESGRMQLTALVRAGLVPTSRILDFGCGCLRAGYWLIHFLAPDCYFGIEPHAGRLRIGVEVVLEQGLLEAKRPRFSKSADFDLTVFGVTFDFVLAYSIWTHAAKPQIQRMLDSLLRASHQRTVVLASYLPAGPLHGPDCLSETWVGTSHESETPGVIRHDLGWIVRECNRRGLNAVELPDPAPDQQRWLKVSLA